MDDGTWRHYWQYPVYGQSFQEIIDVYHDDDEDGVAMRDGVVWMDLTGTRFRGERHANTIIPKSSRDLVASTSVEESRPIQYKGIE
jgi:hypothetical protein